MKAKIFIANCLIGKTIFRIADESMGGIIGELIPSENYKNFKKKIQSLIEEKGIANMSDFKFRILIDDQIELNPEGGLE